MDENKTYPVTGTVTISTEEYRDLIHETYEARQGEAEQRRKWYEQYDKANRFEKLAAEQAEELMRVKEKFSKYQQFVASSEQRTLEYVRWQNEEENGRAEA